MKANAAILISLLACSPLLTAMAPLDEELLAAARKGDANEAAALLKQGAQVNAATSNGETPLHEAAGRGHEAIVTLLLERGATIDTKAVTSNGQTLLHAAASGGLKGFVRLLLDKGATVSAADNDGRTALHLAADRGHKAVVRLLLDKGATVNAADKFGRTPLHQAAYENREAIVRLLLEKGAPVDAASAYGLRPLHLAARRGHEAVVRLLLDKGASVNAADRGGATPLHLAADKGREAVVRLLREKGARVDVKDKSRKTPLDIARGKAGGGTVTGTVTYAGKARETEYNYRRYPNGTFCARIGTDSYNPELIRGNKQVHKTIEVGKGGALNAAVVGVTDIEDTVWMDGYKGSDVTIKFCEYRPFVGVMVNGGNIHVENTDQDPGDLKFVKGVRHYAHAFEVRGHSHKTIFNLLLPEKGSTMEKTVKLRKENQGSFVRLNCDMHEWEEAYFLPVKNPHYAVTGADGSFTIQNVPAGRHKILAWHPFAGRVETDVEVRDGATVTANFQIRKQAMSEAQTGR